MSTANELAHTLVKDGVYEFLYTDQDTAFLTSLDGREAEVTHTKGEFTAVRKHGPLPREIQGSFREALEHLSIG